MNVSTPRSLATSNEEFVAVVLAASAGTRLFALTDATEHPKHLLPVAGIPMLHRLLQMLKNSIKFQKCVVAIAHHDHATIKSLRHLMPHGNDDDGSVLSPEEEFTNETTRTVISSKKNSSWELTVVRLAKDCSGSAEAIRSLEDWHPNDNLVVLPGDLILLDPSPLITLIHDHRGAKSHQLMNSSLSTACTMLLTNVGDVDEHGAPLKESAKQKKGGLSRDEEEIECIALAQQTRSTDLAPRVVWKQTKIDAEEDEDMVGETPKLTLPKPRLRGSFVKVRTDWNDVHVYVISPWVRHLLRARTSIVSLREDLLPLLVSRQFKGVFATFGANGGALVSQDSEEARETRENQISSSFSSGLLERVSRSFGGKDLGARQFGNVPARRVVRQRSPGLDESNSDKHKAATEELLPSQYAVRASVQDSLVFRSHTAVAYLYANREVARMAMMHGDSASRLPLPPSTVAKAKFQSIVLAGSSIGEKVSFKGSVVGTGCQIGTKCRLNNVVLLDNVHVGENTILQNTIVAQGAVLGENCNLNDCQVGPNKELPAGTKDKGETFLSDNLP